MSKVSEVTKDSFARVRTQKGDRFHIPDQSIGSDQLKPLGIEQQHLSAEANPFPWIQGGFQNFVEQEYLEAFNGSPGAGQFRTFGINKRASIPNPENLLGIDIGFDRMSFEFGLEILEETGPNNEKVYKPVNDDFNMTRFVGADWDPGHQLNAGQGLNKKAGTSTANFMEIVFWGEGAQLLFQADSSRDIRTTVDGGSESANLLASNTSFVLGSRNYTTNQALTIASGLSYGLHTVKIRFVSTTNIIVFGYQIMDDTSVLDINKGSAFINGARVINSLFQNLSYNSSFETTLGTPGTKGARAAVYLKSNGDIAHSARYTDVSQLNLASADHSNEILNRSMLYREFGAGRSDDFSFLGTTTSDIAFNMDDNLTCLVGDDIFTNLNVTNLEGLSFQASGNNLKITWFGSGLDIVAYLQGAVNPDIAVVVDGISLGTIDNTSFNVVDKPQVIKIVSGLEIDTHTALFTRGASATGNISIQRFNTYVPKQPTIPSDAILLREYFILGNFSANSTQGKSFISRGTLRKSSSREIFYVGTWSLGGPSPETTTGFTGSTTTNNDYAELNFFGTAVDFRWYGPGASTTYVISIDGVTNLSGAGYTTNAYGTSVSTWTASTGTLVTNAAGTPSNGLTISGIPLGFHTIRVTRTAGTGALNVEAFDVASPIYFPKDSLEADLQYSLMVGNSSTGDSRKFSPLKDVQVQPANWGRAVGIVSSPTTTVTTFAGANLPDMQFIIKSRGRPLKIDFSGAFLHGTIGERVFTQLFVDGMLYGPESSIAPATASTNIVPMSISDIVPLSEGYHLIQIKWSVTTGTGTNAAGRRRLVAHEI